MTVAALSKRIDRLETGTPDGRFPTHCIIWGKATRFADAVKAYGVDKLRAGHGLLIIRLTSLCSADEEAADPLYREGDAHSAELRAWMYEGAERPSWLEGL